MVFSGRSTFVGVYPLNDEFQSSKDRFCWTNSGVGALSRDHGQGHIWVFINLRFPMSSVYFNKTSDGVLPSGPPHPLIDKDLVLFLQFLLNESEDLVQIIALPIFEDISHSQSGDSNFQGWLVASLWNSEKVEKLMFFLLLVPIEQPKEHSNFENWWFGWRTSPSDWIQMQCGWIRPPYEHSNFQLDSLEDWVQLPDPNRNTMWEIIYSSGNNHGLKCWCVYIQISDADINEFP